MNHLRAPGTRAAATVHDQTAVQTVTQAHSDPTGWPNRRTAAEVGSSHLRLVQSRPPNHCRFPLESLTSGRAAGARWGTSYRWKGTPPVVPASFAQLPSPLAATWPKQEHLSATKEQKQKLPPVPLETALPMSSQLRSSWVGFFATVLGPGVGL